MYIALLFLLIFISYAAARLNAAWHPKLLVEKSFEIRDPSLARFFIPDISPDTLTKFNEIENRARLHIFGLAFYVLWGITLVFSLCFILFVPSITASSPLVIELGEESVFSVTTLNQLLPLYLFTLLTFLEICAFCLNIFTCSLDIKRSAAMKVLWSLVTLAFAALSVSAAVSTASLIF